MASPHRRTGCSLCRRWKGRSSWAVHPLEASCRPIATCSCPSCNSDFGHLFERVILLAFQKSIEPRPRERVINPAVRLRGCARRRWSQPLHACRRSAAGGDDGILRIGYLRLSRLADVMYAARFGPTETSYHDMNQKPGTRMGLSSCHKPPWYQAGSFGARLIIAPPVSTAMSSAKIPWDHPRP
jgi:hypothetical protein